MPLVEITIAQGRDAQTLHELMTSVHDAVVNSIDAAPGSVRVIVREVPDDLWLTGGVTLREKRSAAAATRMEGGS